MAAFSITDDGGDGPMIDNSQICYRCSISEGCADECEALNMLRELVRQVDKERKYELLSKYKAELQLIYAEPDPEMEEMAEKIIDVRQELQHIRDYEICIGYVRSNEAKRAKKIVYADCRKVNTVMQAYLPFDFIITFYADTAIMTDNQLKILMFHELLHIEVGQRGFTIRPHDIEDFDVILRQYGLDWNNMDDVPNILDEVIDDVGSDGESE